LLRLSADGSRVVLKVARSYREFLEADRIEWSAKPKASPPLLSEVLKHCADRGWPVGVVALDIPLAPQAVRSYREADRALTRAYAGRGAPVHSPTPERPGTISDAIYRQLTDAGLRWVGTRAVLDQPSFIEVYPHASIIELFGYAYRFPYKVHRRGQYWRDDPPQIRQQKSVINLLELRQKIADYVTFAPGVGLPELVPEQSYSLAFLKGYEDVLDSLVCALSGGAYATGRATAYGDQDAAIWVPTLLR
jgi:predicted RNase H-like nuclease